MKYYFNKGYLVYSFTHRQYRGRLLVHCKYRYKNYRVIIFCKSDSLLCSLLITQLIQYRGLKNILTLKRKL